MIVKISHYGSHFKKRKKVVKKIAKKDFKKKKQQKLPKKLLLLPKVAKKIVFNRHRKEKLLITLGELLMQSS